MAYFMDVHTDMKGLTQAQLKAAHDQDLANEKGTGVHFIRAWGDPKSGHVFCLSEGPNLAAVKARSTRRAATRPPRSTRCRSPSSRRGRGGVTVPRGAARQSAL